MGRFFLGITVSFRDRAFRAFPSVQHAFRSDFHTGQHPEFRVRSSALSVRARLRGTNRAARQCRTCKLAMPKSAVENDNLPGAPRTAVEIAGM